MPVRETLNEATNILKAAGVDTPRLDAEVLLAFAMDVPRKDLLLGNLSPTPAQLLIFQEFVDRRKGREPVARITGIQEFWSRPFKVNEATLVPRPDSETLVEAALQKIPKDKPFKILDLGTGSGCLLLAILSERPLATGVGVDKNKQALEVAQGNALALGLSDRARFEEFDWMDGGHIKQTRPAYDLIISNPPYIRDQDIQTLAPEVARFEPKAALDGGADGLLPYRILIPLCRALLAGKGWVFFEVGQNQEEAVRKMLWETNFETLETHKDLAGTARVVAGFCPFGPS
jgi:release factor glutamine methyltransferase